MSCFWCITVGVVVQHAESQHRGCQLDSSMCHDKNTIGAEGNEKLSHKIYFPGKHSEPCLWFLLRSKSSMRRRKEHRHIARLRFTNTFNLNQCSAIICFSIFLVSRFVALLHAKCDMYAGTCGVSFARFRKQILGHPPAKNLHQCYLNIFQANEIR